MITAGATDTCTSHYFEFKKFKFSLNEWVHITSESRFFQILLDVSLIKCVINVSWSRSFIMKTCVFTKPTANLTYIKVAGFTSSIFFFFLCSTPIPANPKWRHRCFDGSGPLFEPQRNLQFASLKLVLCGFRGLFPDFGI